MWKDTLMSIINDIINWIDTVIFGNKTKTSKVQEEDAPVVPIYGKKAKRNNDKTEAKPKKPRGRAKTPRTKTPTGTRKSSKTIKK